MAESLTGRRGRGCADGARSTLTTRRCGRSDRPKSERKQSPDRGILLEPGARSLSCEAVVVRPLSRDERADCGGWPSRLIEQVARLVALA
jgi:hypothetical protein